MKNSVLCAIDVNDFDQDVVDLAATFARQLNVDLHLLHVTLFPDPTNAAWPAYLGSPDGLVQDNRRLERIQTMIPGVTLVRHHVSGRPVDQVLGFVNRNEPQLLVMGTHARRGVSRVLGSVASRVMRKATCPVLVLKQTQNSQTFSDLQAIPTE